MRAFSWRRPVLLSITVLFEVLTIAFVVLILAVSAFAETADEEDLWSFSEEIHKKYSWDIIEKSYYASSFVDASLEAGDRDLVDWAAELIDAKPQTHWQACIKADVLYRFHLRSRAFDNAMEAVPLESSYGEFVRLIVATFYVKEYSSEINYDHVARFLRRYPEYAPIVFRIESSRLPKLFKYLVDPSTPNHIPVDELSPWFEQMRTTALERKESLKPLGRDKNPLHFTNLNPHLPEWTWTVFEVICYQTLGEKEKVKQLVRAIEQHLIENSDDFEVVRVYFYLVVFLTREYPDENLFDFSWCKEKLHPKTVKNSCSLALNFCTLKEIELAVHYFKITATYPVKLEEAQELSMMIGPHSALLPNETEKLLFEAGLQSNISACYRALGKMELAQQHMVKSIDILKGTGFEGYGFAGATQAATGFRQIEKRILEKEKLSEDDPRYWIDRIEYYQGRYYTSKSDEDRESLIHAFKRGLEVSDPRTYEGDYKVIGSARRTILDKACLFLYSEKKYENAFKLYHEEIRIAPPDSQSSFGARYAIRCNEEYLQYVDPYDDVYWDAFKQHEIWDNYDVCNFIGMLYYEGNLDESEETREKYFKHVEKFVTGQHPSRAFYYGKFLYEEVQQDRAIPWMAKGICGLEEIGFDDGNRNANSTRYQLLFEAYLRADMLDLAVQLHSTSSSLKTKKNMGKLAYAYAYYKNVEKAMEYWRKMNTTKIRLNSDWLTKAYRKFGFDEQIDAFYSEVQRKLPLFDPDRQGTSNSVFGP